MHPLPFLAAVGAAAAVFAAGCGGGEPPKPVAPVEPLVIGKSPPSAPLAVASGKPTAGTPDESGKVARGNAPVIWLDSLTTQGKATLPAGKVVIVHFWATWCAPCQKSLPALQALYAKYRAKGLEIAAIAVDDQKDGIADFAKRSGARFPVAWDDGHAVTDAYKVQSMPSTMIVDKDGNIAHTHQGYHESEDQEIEREIKALLP